MFIYGFGSPQLLFHSSQLMLRFVQNFQIIINLLNPFSVQGFFFFFFFLLTLKFNFLIKGKIQLMAHLVILF